MFKTLVLLAALWLAIRLLRNWLEQRNASLTSEKQKNGSMVQCHYCGTYIPEQDSIYSDGNHYCCNDHRDNENES
ncbi:MAG: hypothetical protein GXP22_05605 [Gammaproteobacteria bacterium]|nr:hypothetical protein [Gammaproteobacteria bacterium]